MSGQLIDEIPLKIQHPPPDDARLAKAAVRCGDKVFTSWRHSDAIRHIGKTLGELTKQEDQGFIDQHGNWYSRYVSARIALRVRQISWEQFRKPSLTSEELWDVDGTPREAGEPYDPMADMKARESRTADAAKLGITGRLLPRKERRALERDTKKKKPPHG